LPNGDAGVDEMSTKSVRSRVLGAVRWSVPAVLGSVALGAQARKRIVEVNERVQRIVAGDLVNDSASKTNDLLQLR
jgi:hypothetical protein